MNLKEIYKEAAVLDAPEFAEHVEVVHPYTGESIKPKDYQLTGLWEALSQDNHRFGLYDTMGSGKSLISYLYAVYHAGRGNQVLVVMPPKLMKQYRSNLFGMFKGLEGKVRCEIFHGTPKKREELKQAWQ